MKKKNKRLHASLKKKIYTTSVTLALTAGTVAGVAAYQKQIEFTPSDESRKLQNNQVLFPDDGDGQEPEQQNDSGKDKSALWDKVQENIEQKTTADFLFDGNGVGADQAKDQVALITEADGTTPEQSQENTGTTDPNQTYVITDDKKKADVVITDPTKKPDTTVTPGTGDTETSGDNGAGTGDNAGNGGHTPDTPHQPSKDPADSGNSDKKDDEPEKPTKRPSSTAKDPDVNIEDKLPSTGGKPFQEGVIKEEDFDQIGTEQNNKYILWFEQDYWSTERLYEGRNVDAQTIFYALECQIRPKDDPSGQSLIYTADSYGTYIRVDGISFDGGETWCSDFPVTVPTGASDQETLIRMSWRVSTKQDWTQTDVSYAVEKTRLFIMNKPIEDEDYVISKDDVINWDDFFVGQYPSEGTRVNLLKYDYQGAILGAVDDRLTELLPGWVEGEKAVSWMYTVERGRHILEPAEKVPLDSKYIAKLKPYWIDEELKVDLDLQKLNTEYCLLQTLTGYEEELSLWKDQASVLKELTVPEYMQAVDIEEATPLTVDILHIPESVLLVNTKNANLTVNESYTVAEDNPNYCAEDGVLYNKEKTEILGIPYRTHILDVEPGVEKIALSANNQLRKLQLHDETLETVPTIDFSCIRDCQVIVEDQIFDAFMETYGDELVSQNCTVSRASEPEIQYTIQNDAVIDMDGRVDYILPDRGDTCKLSETVRSIGAAAFRKADTVTSLILQGKNTIILEKDCLKQSQIQTILCKTQEQVDSLQKQLADAGKTDITLGLYAGTADGYTYYAEEKDGHTITTLLDVPENLTEFTGTIDQGKISVNCIGTGAFSGSHVKWVTLSENTTEIGYEAFKNCTELQGILIEAKDSITIGNKAFDGCSAIRFIGSNAMKAEMKGGYDPLFEARSITNNNTSTFYIMPGAEGYGTNTRTVTGVNGLNGYAMDELEGGGHILYGLDAMDNRWIAVRSGTLLPDELNLPDSVSMIMDFAFADTSTVSGSCKVNFDGLPFLSWIEKDAFAHSDVSGDITIGYYRNTLILNSEAFYDCKNLTSVTVNSTIILLGENVFMDSSRLKLADLKSLGSTTTLNAGLFTGCDALEEIRLYETEPPETMIYGTTFFTFNGNWTQEEEAQHLRLKVPEGCEESYVMAWRYSFTGYPGATNTGQSPFLDLWNGMWQDYVVTYWQYPENSVVDAMAKERLCGTENYLRKLTGLKTVSEPTDLYIWHQIDIYLSLADVPSYIRSTDLSTKTLDMPEGWTLDTIEADAFANASHLETVDIPSTLVGISSNAFRGSAGNSEKLTLNFTAETPLELMNGTKDDPFVFGISEDKLRIHVPDGAEKSYISSWVYPLSGYEDEADVLMDAASQIADAADSADTQTEESEEVTQIRVRRKAAEILLPVENRLRKMMGMDALQSIDDGMLCMAVPAAPDTDTESATEPEENTEITEGSETPETDQNPENSETSETEQKPEESNLPENGQNPEDSENSEPDQTPENSKTSETDPADEDSQTPETEKDDEETDKTQKPDQSSKTEQTTENSESADKEKKKDSEQSAEKTQSEEIKTQSVIEKVLNVVGIKAKLR